MRPMSQAELLDLFQRLGMALAIGFLVGVERGWTLRDAPEGGRAAGLRTHAIIGLFGGLSGAIGLRAGPIPLAALTLVFGALFLAYKWREGEQYKSLSATSGVAGLLVFALGVYCVLGDMRVAAAAGVALTILLAFKHALHEWLARLQAPEIDSALLILAATAIALPLLPNYAIDPWGAVNLHDLWMLTILVAGVSFAGYVAVRVLGENAGLALGAFVGAIVSSTATTVDLGRRAKSGEASVLAAAAAANLASVVMFARFSLLTLLFASGAFVTVAPVALTGGLVSLAAAALLHLLAGRTGQGAKPPPLSSPLHLKSVGWFALLLGALIVIGRIMAVKFGSAGVLPFAGAAGLADVDAATLAVGRLMQGGVTARAGADAILLGAAANTFSKSALAIGIGGPRFGGLFALCSAAAIAAGLGVWFLL